MTIILSLLLITIWFQSRGKTSYLMRFKGVHDKIIMNRHESALPITFVWADIQVPTEYTRGHLPSPKVKFHLNSINSLIQKHPHTPV